MAQEEAELIRENLKRYRKSNRRPAFFDEETERARRFTGIAFRGPAHDRRAWMPWSGMDVWEVIEAHDKLGYEELPDENEIPKKALDLALTYYAAYPKEVDLALAENRRTPEEWQRLYPHVKLPPICF